MEENRKISSSGELYQFFLSFFLDGVQMKNSTSLNESSNGKNQRPNGEFSSSSLSAFLNGLSPN